MCLLLFTFNEGTCTQMRPIAHKPGLKWVQNEDRIIRTRGQQFGCVLLYCNGLGHQVDGDSLKFRKWMLEKLFSCLHRQISSLRWWRRPVRHWPLWPSLHCNSGPKLHPWCSCIGKYKIGKNCHSTFKNGVYKSPVPLVSLIFIFICQVISIIYL